MKSKMIYPICLILFFINMTAGVLKSQTVKAVNDTIDLVPGISKTIDLLANDTLPPGDSIRITSLSTGSSIIKVTWILGGIYSFVEPKWGNVILTSSGNYHLKDFSNNKTSSAQLIFRIRDHSSDSLYVNNINALFMAYGNHFFSPINGAHFIVPKESGKSTIFSNSFWIGGLDVDDSLHLAAEKYRQGPSNGNAGLYPDFYAGPVMDSVNYTIFQDTLWNYIWNIKKSDIEYHKAHWADPGYIPLKDILTWPGNGSVAMGEAKMLAPFYDRNGDGIYDPLDGDYPLIRGDQALFFIFNDDRDSHKETNGRKMKIEVHGMAYAFNMPEDSAFNNTVFLNYTIFNRSQQTYNNTYLGVFTDLDIGYAQDDYIGCDVERGSYFGYNGTPVDGSGQPGAYGENPPAQSVTILAGPFMDPDNIDNPSKDNSGNQLCNESVNGTGFGDGVIDNERMGMREFHFINNNTSGVPFYMQDPTFAPEYYHLMKGIWKDGTPMIYGGDGHSSTGGYGPECKFMFPGYSDTLNWGVGCQMPNGPVYWTEKTAGNNPGDRRGLASMGPFTFHPGDVQELDMAFVFVRDYIGSDSLKSVTKLGKTIDIVRNAFRTNILPNGQQFLGLDDQASLAGNSFTLFPNPANDFVTIHFRAPLQQPASISVTDMQGRMVRQVMATSGSQHLNLDVASLPAGLYIVQIKEDPSLYFNKLSIIH